MMKIYTTTAKKTKLMSHYPAKRYSKLFLLIGFVLCVLINSVYAQQYVNSNLSTGNTLSTGVTAPAGTTWSEVQPGNTTIGIGATTGSNSVADNFYVCSNWTVNQFTFYAYITDYAASFTPFNYATIAIFNTDPSVGNPAPIFGDRVTNLYNTSFAADIYRVPNATNDQRRKVFKIPVTVPSWNLTPGNYWVEFSIGNIQGAGSFVPLSTVIGTTTQPGNNAKTRTALGTWSNIVDNGNQPQDIPFMIDYTTSACSGQPTPGATSSSLAAACANVPFTLTLANPDCVTGITNRWQYSTNNGATWTNITGATSSLLTTTFSALGLTSSTANVNVLFRDSLRCSNTGLWDYSIPITVTLSSFLNCYTVPGNTNSCANDDIINVKFGTLDNSSTPLCPSNGYVDYTSTVDTARTIYSGAANLAKVRITNGGSFEYAGVWIDYNRNSVFENSEFTSFSFPFLSQGSYLDSAFVSPPYNATTYYTRMRFRSKYNAALSAADANSSYTWGETEDYLVKITPAPSCNSATINPGALTAPAAVCPSTTFSISLANISTLSSQNGISYLWYSSTDGVTYNTTGFTSSTYTGTQSVATYYKVTVTCSFGGSFTSTAVLVGMNPFYNCYCIPAYTNSTDNDITIRVTYAGIDNPSGNSPNNGYSDYTQTVAPAVAYRGQADSIKVQIPSGFSEYAQVWIDYNHDGIFGTDEYNALGSTTSSGGTIRNTITIPLTATLGITRMRVRIRYASYWLNSQPCNGGGYGETEDYLVDIRDVVSCSGVPSLGTINPNYSSLCAGESVIISSSNAATLTGTTGLSLQWYSSTDGVTYTPISGATTPTISQVITATTYFYLSGTCASNISNALPVTITLNPVTVCYCASNATTSNGSDIFRMKLGTLDNLSQCTSGAPGPGSIANRYSNYTSGPNAPAPAIIYSGTTNAFLDSINNCSFAGINTTAIWIDLDKNGAFDANEKLFTSLQIASPRKDTGFLTIPATLINGDTIRGITRMRIVNSNQSPTVISPCGTYSAGETEDYLVDIQPATACTGGFNAGNTVTSLSSVCPADLFQLSFSNTTPTSGLTFQWQQSVNGTTGWLNCPGSPNANTYSLTESSSYYYRVQVTCQSTITTSNPVLVTLRTTGCICTPSSTCTLVNITNISFPTSITNPTGCSANGYANYSAINSLIGNFTSGGNNAITVTGTGSRYTYVWIDLNNNDVFESTEFFNLGFSSAATVTGNILILPATLTTSITGPVLMRVRVSSTALNSSGACTVVTDGETEDYAINITPCIAAQFESQPGDQLNISCGSNASFNVGVSSSVSPNETYQWQVRTTPTGTWSNIVNGPIGTATYAGVNTNILTITSVPISFSNYFYRVYVNGNCAKADTSLPGKLIVVTSGTTIFNNQPQSTSVGCNTSASFSFAVTTGTSPVYQWQYRANSTASWSTLTNGLLLGSTVAGATTTSLGLTSVTNFLNGYQFRAYVSSACSPSDTTTPATLNVTATTAILSIASNQPTDTICNGTPITFTASMNFNGTPNISLAATGNSSTTVIPMSTTTGLSLGQFVAVTNGTGAFLPNTYITVITPGVSITVNQAPSTPIVSGATIGAYTFGFKFYVNNFLQQSSASNTYTTSSLTGVNSVRCAVLVNDPTSCVPVNPTPSNVKTIVVTPNTFTGVAITSNLGNTDTITICSGASITFTANPTNGGTAPTYQWKKNGFVITGETASTFTSNTLVNGDIISVVMNSNAAAELCSAPNPASSNAFVMRVNQVNAFSVNIAASPGISACPGTNVTFTATPINGVSPFSYQWYINNGPVGTNSPSFASNTLANSDLVKCIVLSSPVACLQGSPATSNIITMSINSQTASVSIGQSPPNNAVCAGSSVTYTATPTNGGSTPSYQFYVNGVPVANTSNTYTYIPGANDSISVEMTSSFACATPNPATAFVKQPLLARPTSTIINSNLTCGFNSITLDAGATAGSGTITGGVTGTGYSWSLNGGASIGNQSTLLATATGNYTVTITNSNGCTFTSPAYNIASFTTPAAMSGNYTIGAVTATVVSFTGSTVTVNSSASFSLGAIVSITSGPGAIPANTIVTAISGNVITLSQAPSGLTTSTVIAGSTCTNYIGFRTAFADLNARAISGSCVFNVSAGFTETLTTRTATASGPNTGTPATTINVISTANMYVGAVPYVSSGTGVFAPGTYITAINSATQFTVSAAPSTGLVLNDVITLNRLDLGSSLLNLSIGTNKAIVFQKSGSGANPLITAYTGVGTSGGSGTTLPDGMIGLLGVDSVTFDGINLADTVNNTLATNMEYGFGLFKLANNDGAQRNTIKNCRIALNNANSQAAGINMPGGSIGILSLSALSTTPNTALSTLASSAETNSYNKFYSNNITKCNYGIAFVGYGGALTGISPTGGDAFNDVGGATSATGNTITNFGLSTATVPAAGIYAANQWSLNVSNNNISSGSHGNQLRGIYGVSGPGANVSINNNSINLTSVGTTVTVSGIDNFIGQTLSNNTVNLNNNSITASFTGATSGSFYGVYNQAACTNLNMNGNTISGTTFASSATPSIGLWYALYSNAGCQNASINNNTISNNNISSTNSNGSAIYTGAVNGIANASTISVSGNTVANNIRNASLAAPSTMRLLQITGCAGSSNINNNTITDNSVNLTVTGTNTFTLSNIYRGVDSTSTINNNVIRNNGININIAGTSGAMTLSGIETTGTSISETISGNAVSRLYVSTTAASITNSAIHVIYGLLTTGNVTRGTKVLSLNRIDSLYTNSAFYGKIFGISNALGANVNIYRNKVSSLWPGFVTSGTAGNSQVDGIRFSSASASGSSVANIYNNMVSLDQATVPSISGVNVGLINSTTDGIRGLDILSTTTNSTINVYNNSFFLTGTGVTNFGASGIYHTVSATATTAALDMRNNIIVNTCTYKGSGTVAAYKRNTAATYGNYASTSNNNNFYVTTGTNQQEVYDGATGYTLAAFRVLAAVTPRESVSKNFLAPFISNTDLHLQSCGTNSSQFDAAGTTLALVTTDIDNETRNSPPDMGADEFSASSFAGSVTTNTTICSGFTSGLLNLVSTYGTISVTEWQYSTDSTNWIGISGTAGLTSYTSGALTITTWFRASVSSSTCSGSAFSLPAKITVNPLPQISLTSGGSSATTASVCLGSNIQFYGSATAAFASPWVSGTTSVAAINTTTGLALGSSAGNSIITYTNSNGCQTTLTLTVTALPAPITGPSGVCLGSTITLTGVSATSWTSSSTGVATVSASGVITALTAGTTNITYSSGGCTSAVDTITVYPKPTISGVTTLCAGSSNTLSGTPSPNAFNPWVSSNASAATITDAGFITGVASVTTSTTTNITYTNSIGCVSNAYVVTVNPAPTVTGSTTICQGSITTLTGSATNAAFNNGATPTTPWYTANSAIVSLTNAASANILITGVAAGTTAITYTNSSTCSKTVLVTVRPLPKKFHMTRAGDGTYCTSSAGVLVGMDSTQASVTYQLYLVGTPSTAVSGAVAAGNGGPISFGVRPAGRYFARATNDTTGCIQPTTTDSVTISSVVAPTITGDSVICVGSTTTLTPSSSPNTVNPWVSDNNPVATVDNGLITAISVGTVNITFTNSTGCPSVPKLIRVNALSVGGTVGTDTAICVNQPLTRTLTLTGNTGNVQKWQISTDGGATYNDIVNTLNTYFVSSAPTLTTRYRAVVQSVGVGCVSKNSNPAIITINPLPDVSNLNMTGGGSFCSGSNGVLVGLTGTDFLNDYQLIRVPSTNVGTPIFGPGTTISFGYVDTAGTYTAQAITLSGCRASIPITATTQTVSVGVYPLPVVKINQQGPINICLPDSQRLTASPVGTATTPTSYQWYSYGTAIPGANSSSFTISGTGTNVISVQGLNGSVGGCNSLKSHAIVVAINTPPANVVAIPDTSVICVGGSQTLNVSSQDASATAISMQEDFNDTANLQWRVVSASTSPLVSNWKLNSSPFQNTTGTVAFSNFSTRDGGWFYQADADAGGSGSITTTGLYSDTFSLGNYTNASLTFEQALRSSTLYDDSVEVDISINAGNSWTRLTNYTGTSSGSTISNAQTTANQNISLNSYIGQDSLMLRFFYKSRWGYYWILDNIRVSGNKQFPTIYTWLPATSPATGAQVVVAPLVNTSYIVSATSSVGCVAKDTSVVNIKPRPVINSESADTTLCLGESSPPLTVEVTNYGLLSYQWYSNATSSNTGGTLMPSETADTLYPDVSVSGTKYYYVIATDALCGTKDTSRAIKVVVNANTAISVEPVALTQVCINGTAPTLSVTASGISLTYQWYSNSTSSYSSTTVVGSAASYTPSVATAGTTYYYVIVTGTCGKDTSAIVSVVVNANASITTQPVAPAAACAGGTATPLTVVAAGAGTLTYQWYSNTINSNTGGVSLGATAQTASYTPVITTTGTTYYYVVVTGSCGPISSNAVAVVVNPVTVITTEPTAPAAVCAGGSATALSVVATGTGTLTYQWYSNTTNVYTGATSLGSATTASYTPSVATAGTTYYYAIVTGTCGKDTSAIVSVVVNANNTFTLSSASGTNAQTACINTAITNITYTTTGATGATFSGLPTGVTGSWAANLVTISGTPTIAGPFSYTVTFTGGCGNVTATGTITVTAANTITLSSAAATNAQTPCINTAITNITYATTGATGATVSGLPAGVTGSWAANVVTISGTPTAAGSFSYTVTLTGGCGAGTATGTITVTAANTVTLSSAATTNAQTVCINTAIINITYATTGATGATFSGLPAGVTGNWAANVVTISGTPTAAGPFSYTVTLTGGCGNVTATGTITVTSANTVTLSSAANTNAQTPCINTAITNITYATTGATGATVSGLPAGVTGSWAANVVTISGTPTLAGPNTYTVTLTGGCGAGTATGTINVNPANMSAGAASSTPTLCLNSALTSITHSTNGATGIGTPTLPPGVTATWSANTITISGTPTASGTFNYSIPLTGGCGTANATGTITVTAGNSGPLPPATYTIGGPLCTDFSTIAAAVNYLNTYSIQNVAGNWIFNVPANYTETAPVGGIALGSVTTPTVATSLNNVLTSNKHIIFRKNGTGNNPKIIAPIGTAASFNTATPDGIWSLRGVDYVTIDGIDLQDNNTTSATDMMEYGYGLFKTSATDGAQNDTIRNCTITLNRNNVVAGNANTFGVTGSGGSVGIAVINGTAIAATTAITPPIPPTPSSPNSNNKFLSNTIQNANIGIGISGFAGANAAANADSGNGIGDSTVSNSGNRIINFGGGTSAAIPSYGVYLLNQVDAVVAYNEINNHADGTGVDHLSSQYGIETVHATGTTGIGIKANNVTITGGANSNYYGIDNSVGGGTGFAVSIVLNNVSVKIPSVATTNTVGSVTGIKNSNATAVTTVNINGNTFKGSVISGTGTWTAIYNTGSATATGIINMNNNVIDSNAIQTTGTPIVLQNNGTTYQTLNVNSNTISRNNKSVSSATATDINWLNVASTSGAINVQGNLIEKDTVSVLNTNTNTVTASGIRFIGPGTGATFTTNANTVRKLSIQGINGSNVATLRGYASNVAIGATPTESIFGNKISNLYISPASGSTGTPVHALYGIFSGGSTSGGSYSKSIFSNLVDTLYVRNNADATPVYNSIVTAICNAGTPSNNNGNNILIYKNKIAHIIPFGTGITTIGRGIWLGSMAAGATTSKAYIYNNMVNMDLTEAFDGASNGSLLTTADGIRGIDLSQTTADSTFLYFNTVRIAGAGNPTSTFGSSAASINTNTAQVVVRLRNNIFVNKSTAGSTGYAVALRKAGTTSLYDTASRNNLFYVDTTGRRYMYYEVATGFNTLSGTWTTPGSRELNSVTQVEPVFVKASDGTDSLHLNVNTNCAMNASGIAITLPTPSTADDIDGATRGTPPDMGADEFDGTGLGIGQWAGVNTNWNDQINWCGLVPASNTDVTIPGSRANYPSIDNTTLPVPMCRNIAVNTGGVVNVLSGGKMQIYGNTSTAGGNINAKEGTIEFVGTAAQTIGAGTFQNNNVRNITINNAVGVTLGGQLNLLNKLGFAGSSRNFNIGDSLLFMKSSDTLTAYLSNITKDANTGSVVSGNTVTGNAVVERYISSRRAWRLLSMPTTHNAQTIKMAWQEGATLNSQNPMPGYGLQITSNLANWATAGFDTFSVAGPSVKVYNPVTNLYDGIVSTTDPVTGKFVIGKAYMTFIRGDRSITQISQSPTITILREKGSFNLGNIAPITVGTASGQAVSIGNPYAAQIDFGLVKSSSTNVGNTYYYWDPKVGTYGAYQNLLYNTATGTSSCSNCITGSSYANGNYNIQSGQGFFITTSGGAATVNFNENQKVDGSNLVSRVNSPLSQLRTTLYKVQNGVSSLYDGVLNIFDSNNSNAVDENDAIKLGNFNENLGLQRDDKVLAIENRMDIQESDTIFYKIGQVRLSAYRFSFTPENLVTNGLGAFLEDKYLNTSTPVSLAEVTNVDFTINTDAGSYASDRFRLVFKQLAPVPVTFVDVKAVKVSKDVNVSWKVENEINIATYVVERSSNGIAFTAIGNVLANGTSVYSLMDRQALSGNNFYRIKAIGIAGDIKYSRVVKVTFEMSPAISMYPNPLNNDRTIHLSFKDMAVGNYAVKVMNSLGQSVMVRNINHTVTNAQYEIILDKNLAHGNYSIEIVDAKDQKTVMNFLF